jgi:hypothetical protein
MKRLCPPAGELAGRVREFPGRRARWGMPSLTYLEELGDLSPATATFAITSQQSSAVYLFANPSFDDLRNSIIDLLGYTSTRATDGRISRTLPARHPAYQWKFADTAAYQGVGSQFTLVQPSPGLGSPIIPNFPLYASYHVRVSYSPRPYNSWQDRDISVLDGTYYPKDDAGSGAGTAYKCATEWLRFTEWVQRPLNNFISAQQGQMVFRANGSGGAVQPDGISFQDSPKLYLPDSVLTVKWHMVPYRYILSANSYLTKFIGHINQNAFGPTVVNAGTFGPYSKGTLLYVGATPTAIYTPPVPDEGLLAFNAGNGFLRGMLCDLDVNFLYTARTIGTVTTNTPDMSAVNRNWVVAGHNLLPWLTTRKFYYATTYDPANPADQTKWRPSYNSFPMELLFTDPDAQNSPVLNP